MMTVQIEKNSKTVTMRLEGRLDTTTAPALEKAINEECKTSEELVLDLKNLNYISSAGLRVLLGTQKKMNKQGSTKLTNVCEAVMDVLEMTGFADILVIE